MKIIFSLIFLSLSLLSETINEQIHSLETATPQERVALMNHIKEQLISMNEEKRMKALSKLRVKLQAKNKESQLETPQTYCKDNKNHQKGLHLKMHEGMMQSSHEDNFRQMNERHQYLRQNNNNRERMEEENRNEDRREEQNRNERRVEYEGNNQEQNNHGREP